MSSGSEKDAVRRFWEEVFNKGNLALIDEMIGDNYTFNGQHQTRDEIKKWVIFLRTQLKDLHFTLQDVVEDGDKIAVRWTLVGKMEMTNTGTNVITFQNGKAISNWQNGGTPNDLHPVDPTPKSGQ